MGVEHTGPVNAPTGGSRMTQPPKDGNNHKFSFTWGVEAFWDREYGRWVLTRELKMDYLPEGAIYLRPKNETP